MAIPESEQRAATYWKQGFASRTIDRSLTSAEILDLSDTPVELLPFVPGSAYQVVGLQVVVRFGTQGYTWNDSAFITDGNATLWILTDIAEVLASTEDSFAYALNTGPWYGQTALNVSGVSISTDSNPTGGDGTIDLRLFYNVIDL